VPLTPQKSHALTLTGLFLLALVIRLAVLFQLQGSDVLWVILGDSKAYHQWALTIAAGDWLGTGTFYQSPLYPYFLAVIHKLFGPSLTPVRIIQAILGSLACVALFEATRRLFNPRTGLIAGVLLAIFPVAVFFDLIIQKSALDSILIALLLLSISHLWRPSQPLTSLDARHGTRDARLLWFWPSLLGLTTGLFILNRENALPIAIILPLLLFLHLRSTSSTSSTPHSSSSSTRDAGRWTRDILIYTAGLALILLPVLIRNKTQGGEFHLTTSQFGPNFYIGNNPSADGTYAPLIFGRGDAQYERQDAVDLAQKALGRTLTPGEVSAYWRDQALSFIKEHPADWAKLTARKTALAINATELGDTEDLYTWSEYSSLLNILSLFHTGILIPLAGAGLLLTWPHRKRLAPLYAITVVYFASVIAFYIFARYRYPGILLLIPFAAATLAAPWRILLTPGATGRIPMRPVSACAIGGALLTLAILSNLTFIPSTNIQSSSHANLGTYFATHGQPDKALPHLVAAIDFYPAFPDNYFNLALFYVNNKHPDLALQVLDEGLKQSPSHPQLLRLRAHAASLIK
jgi:tetratricopeptide (TPR) repeat protein